MYLAYKLLYDLHVYCFDAGNRWILNGKLKYINHTRIITNQTLVASPLTKQ